MEAVADGVWIRAWKPLVPGIREVFHARFVAHAYPSHTHDTWTLFLVDDGAIRYDLGRRARGAEPSMVSILPPHVVHDGRPATANGFRKRVLYLETSLIGEHLIGPAVDRPVIPHPALREDVSAIHDVLGCIEGGMEAETRIAIIAERIRASFGEAPAAVPPADGRDLAEALRAWLDARISHSVTMRAAAEELGAGTTRLARAFATTYGIAPHQYVLGRRMEAARDRILDGQSLADVATEVGFADQAHLSRRFRQHLGTTPGRFARSHAELDEMRDRTRV
jgi:AraC-like DNA-binding protein